MPDLSPAAALVVALTLVVRPALIEELIFRGLLLPRYSDALSRSRLYATTAVALLAFVAAHPLNALLFWPAALRLFTSPAYLTLAALLGLTCTAAYLSSGSIWPPVAIHWVTVAVWILLLGGHARIARAQPLEQARVARFVVSPRRDVRLGDRRRAWVPARR
jgi:predicted Abi (CAAX) family protease